MPKRSAFRDTWKDYLSFSKRERRGIFALLLIIFLQISFLVYLRYFPSKEPARDFSTFEKEVNDFYATLRSPRDSLDSPAKADSKVNDESAEKKSEKAAELFAFNPNNLPPEDWQRLGFSEKQIRVIKNYEAKGGKFYSKENLKKMYCISDKDYERIEPYIVIPEKPVEYKETFTKKSDRAPLLIDIGIADSTELTKLKGIGPAFARRISVYRNKLGGFVNKEQLLEVWGFTDSLYQSLLPNICLNDSLNIRKINLNAAAFDELRNQPYIGYQLASLVCNYRKQHNGFKTPDEIKKIPLVNEQLYGKLAPYLKVE